MDGETRMKVTGTTMDAETRRKILEKEDMKPDDPYPMDQNGFLGHAFIVNNLAKEETNTVDDVKNLANVYTQMGFIVKPVENYQNCSVDRMEEIRSEMMSEDLHKDSNCFMLTILTHGDEFGNLAAVKSEDKRLPLVWQIDEYRQIERVKTILRNDEMKDIEEIKKILGIENIKEFFGKEENEKILEFSQIVDDKKKASEIWGTKYINQVENILKPYQITQKFGTDETKKIVEGLTKVKSLHGKPKILIIDACRGGNFTQGQTERTSSSARGLDEDEETELVAVPDKADFYIAYATVPNYGTAGSHFMKSLANNLRQYRFTYSIDRIFNCVKHDVARIKHSVQDVKGDVKICPEDRSSLRRVLKFPNYFQAKETEGSEPKRVKMIAEPSDTAPISYHNRPVDQQSGADSTGNDNQQMQTSQTAGRNQPPGPSGAQSPAVTQVQEQTHIPQVKTTAVPTKLAVKKISALAKVITGRNEYTNLATELSVKNPQVHLANNPQDITTATKDMLTEWKNKFNEDEGDDPRQLLITALEDAGLRIHVPIVK